MDIALCTIDGEVYSGIEFSTLDPGQIERLRYALVCQTCRGPAFYRKASKDGKKACFGADHADKCALHVESGHTTSKAVSVLVDKILVAKNLLSIDFGTGSKDRMGKWSSRTIDSEPTLRSGTSKRHDLAPSTSKTSKLKISSILRLLIGSPRFSKSDILVNTGSVHPFKAKNLFINCREVDLGWFMDMQQQERNTWRGYWGTVRTCTAAWMTVADVLIKTDNLNPGTFSKFKKKNSELDYEDVVGCPILIFGALKKSANDRLFVAVEGTTAVVILK